MRDYFRVSCAENEYKKLSVTSLLTAKFQTDVASKGIKKITFEKIDQVSCFSKKFSETINGFPFKQKIYSI